MAARPVVTVHGIAEDAQNTSVGIPSVFLAPIRSDIVQFVHTNMNKNARQAYAVFSMAGMQHSAHSWGTGRAVSRIPRVSGGGTSRAGQGAFGNMCRSGRMFAPTKTWRKWHRKINVNQKRYAVVSAVAASALPALVMARGHVVDQVPEFPLVLDSSVESIKKTREAVAVLKQFGAYADVEKSKNSRQIRTGRGKMRDRRHVQRKGPLVVYRNDNGITQAFRNLPGVDLANVESLNLLQLAPGGHLGRFIIWTAAAFEHANNVFGSTTRLSTTKNGYHLPHNIMSNSDITRIINSDEVQQTLKAQKTVSRQHSRQKKNPLKNLGVKIRLNPYAQVQKRANVLAAQQKNKVSAARVAGNKRHRATQAANYARLSA